MRMKHTFGILLAAVSAAQAQSAFPDHFVGDAGGMLVASQPVVQGASGTISAMPYVYGDYGRFYARVDTFGVKALPMGEGHLEVAARVSTEGFKAHKTAFSTAGDRSAPVPVGLGTFQRTALGGVFAYVFHDTTSGGQLLELSWAGKVALGRATLYPQLGVEHRSAAYVQHLYGVSAAQSSPALPAYQAGASTVPVLSLHATVPLQGPWSLQLMGRYRAWDSAVRNSPMVDRSGQATGYAALTYTWN